MLRGRFVAYVPTAFKVIDGRVRQADEASIVADLQVLRPRFDGVITYSSVDGVERVADAAARLGFRAVIMGLLDPGNAAEWANLIAAAKRHPALVAGVSVGNELAFGKRGDAASIAKAIAELRREAPTLAVATTEPFHLFLEPAWQEPLRELDFLLANVHPVFEPWFQNARDDDAAQYVVNVAGLLAAQYCGPILVKETGVPTAPSERGFTVERQASFYRVLQTKFANTATRAFAYFAAFDAPWREFDVHPVPGPHPEEAHWGLYDEARNPKPVVAEIPLLPIP